MPNILGTLLLATSLLWYGNQINVPNCTDNIKNDNNECKVF